MAMADHLLDRIPHTTSTPRTAPHCRDRQSPERTTPVGKSTIRADQLQPGDTIKGRGTVDTVNTAPHHDVVVRFTNGSTRRYAPTERVTIEY